MKEVHVLVDLEKNQPAFEEVECLVPDLTDIWLFHGKHKVLGFEVHKVPLKLKMLGGNRATKLNKVRPQIISVLGIMDASGQLVDTLLCRLIHTGGVPVPDVGRLRYTFG